MAILFSTITRFYQIFNIDVKLLIYFPIQDFTHKLVVTEFCGSWTRFNRDAVIGLYDSYNKAQVSSNKAVIVSLNLIG